MRRLWPVQTGKEVGRTKRRGSEGIMTTAKE
jgi:hypothetical protein